MSVWRVCRVCGVCEACECVCAQYSQAVHHGAALPTLSLPLVHVGQQAQEGLLGVGDVTIRRPAQELELAHHQLAFLQLDTTEEEERTQTP